MDFSPSTTEEHRAPNPETQAWLICTTRVRAHDQDAGRGPLAFLGRTVGDQARFDKFVFKHPGEDACWTWFGALLGTGYGTFWFQGKARLAHRVSWFLSRGSWPDDCVLHKCDETRCVRPDHLFAGTKSDNALDREFKRRGKEPERGEDHGQSKLDNSDVREIRKLYASGLVCREIAVKFDVSDTCIKRIIRRETWTHI